MPEKGKGRWALAQEQSLSPPDSITLATSHIWGCWKGLHCPHTIWDTVPPSASISEGAAEEPGGPTVLSLSPSPLPLGLFRVLLTRAHLILQQPCKEPRAQRTDPTWRGKEERDQHCPLNKQEKCKVMGPRSGILSHQIILDSLCSLITSAETQTEPPIFMNILLLFPLILPLHSIHCSLTEQCLCYQGIWCHQNCACWQANNSPGEALSPSTFSVLLKGTSCAVFPALV